MRVYMRHIKLNRHIKLHKHIYRYMVEKKNTNVAMLVVEAIQQVTFKGFVKKVLQEKLYQFFFLKKKLVLLSGLVMKHVVIMQVTRAILLIQTSQLNQSRALNFSLKIKIIYHTPFFWISKLIQMQRNERSTTPKYENNPYYFVCPLNTTPAIEIEDHSNWISDHNDPQIILRHTPFNNTPIIKNKKEKRK